MGHFLGEGGFLAASSNTWLKALSSSGPFSRRNVQIVSWSGCVSAHNTRVATLSYVDNSMLLLEKTPLL